MPDYSKLSDADLMAQLQPPEPSKMSDQELMSALSEDQQAPDNMKSINDQRRELLANPEQASSIDPLANQGAAAIGVRAQTGLTRTPEGKANVIRKAFPELDTQITKDGKVTVNGKYYDLAPENAGAFLYDALGMMAEGATKNLPLAANLAATVATGGASIPAQIAVQAFATGAGEGIKELMAQGLAQEKPSAPDIALQTLLGGAGPIADKAFMASTAGLKNVAKNIAGFQGPAKDIGPELLNATSNIRLGVGEKVFEKMNSGEDLTSIITPENASAGKPSEILNNTFFGNKSNDRSPQNFVDTLKYNIRNTSSDKIDSVKKMYQDIWGLTPQTLETLIKNPTRDVINSGLFADNSALTVGANFASKLADGDRALENEYGQTLTRTMQNPKFKNAKVNIGSALDEMFKAGATPDVNPTGIGIFENNGINQGYTGDAAKKVYGVLLKKLEDNKLGLSSESSQILKDILARNPKANIPTDVTERMTKGGHFKELSAPAAYRFIAEIKPLLNKTFEGGGLSGSEKGPLAGFMKNIRGQLGQISPEMKAMNQKYENYQSARTFFGDGKAGNLQDMLNINSKMAQAYADPGIRTFLGKLDQIFGHNELTNMVDHLGASQEMKAFFDKASGKVEGKLQGLINDVRSLADKTSTHGLQNMTLSGYSNLLPKDKQFLDPMWNHLIASEFQNKPLSIFKSKYIGLMALGAAGMGHVGILPALGVGMAISSPRNIARGLTTLQKLKGINKNIASKTAGVSSKVGQSTNRIVLQQLLQSARKAKEASNKK